MKNLNLLVMPGQLTEIGCTKITQNYLKKN